MTRRGVLAAASAGVVAVLLSGCVGGTDTPATPTSTPTLSVLTFEDGAALDPAQVVAWTDPLVTADGYTRAVAEGTTGSWSYTSAVTGCILGYQQVPLTSEESADDDAAASDALLAASFSATVDEIAPYVEDGPGRFLTQSGIVETRAALGADRGTTYLISARALSAVGIGFLGSLSCPQSIDVAAEWDRLNAESRAFELFFSAAG